MILGLLRVAPTFLLRRKTAVHTRDPERAAVFARDALGHRAELGRTSLFDRVCDWCERQARR